MSDIPIYLLRWCNDADIFRSTEPGAHPQLGTLVAADHREVVIEIKDAVHLHFPRIGYIVRAQ